MEKKKNFVFSLIIYIATGIDKKYYTIFDGILIPY